MGLFKLEKNNIIRIAVIGAESTGKSTLVKELANYYKTTFVSEYARDYFNEHSIENYSIDVFDKIYRTQLENEKKELEKAKRFLFCDTTLITGKIWSEEVFGTTAQFIHENWHQTFYDLYLVTQNDVPWVADGQRKNSNNRDELLRKNIELLQLLKAKFYLVNGLGEQRLKNAVNYINREFGIK